MKESLLHFMIFTPILIFIIVLSLILCSFNIFLWIPYIIYICYILNKQPNYKEIELMQDIGNSLKMELNSEIYNRVFISDIENIESLKDNKAKLLIWHPHGSQTISYVIHRLCTKSPIHPYIKNTKLAVHSVMFQVPILRELSLMLGFIPATRETIKYYLNKGVSVALFPGGVREMDYCGEKDNKCYLKSRKGFIEIAKELDIEIIPVYVAGEQQFFKVNDNNKYYDILTKIVSAITGYTTSLQAFRLFNIDNILKWLRVYIGCEDYRTYTYMGKPIKVNTMDEYVHELQRIYGKVKEKYNIQSDLEII
jgi:1-acyl-sn-glycerol-3-phosphate acyltransferase